MKLLDAAIVIIILASLLRLTHAQDHYPLSHQPGFDRKTGFTTLGIESPQDWHEPQWTEWIVRMMRLDARRGLHREVETRSGKIVDILTDYEAVEVEWTDGWYEAIGQSLLYSIETNRTAAVLLLTDGSDKEQQEILRCQAVCARAGIRFYVQQVPKSKEAEDKK